MIGQPMVKTGTVEGTGATINVSLGFIPSYVKCVNIDDAGGLEPTLEWIKGMAAASGLKTLGTPTYNMITTLGISEYAGSDTPGSEAEAGFSIGADTDLNVSAETIVYIAFR